MIAQSSSTFGGLDGRDVLPGVCFVANNLGLMHKDLDPATVAARTAPRQTSSRGSPAGVRRGLATLVVAAAFLAGCGVFEPSGDPVRAGTDRSTYAPGDTITLQVVNMSWKAIDVSPGLCWTLLQVEDTGTEWGWENVGGVLSMLPGPGCGVGFLRDRLDRHGALARGFQIKDDVQVAPGRYRLVTSATPPGFVYTPPFNIEP